MKKNTFISLFTEQRKDMKNGTKPTKEMCDYIVNSINKYQNHVNDEKNWHAFIPNIEDNNIFINFGDFSEGKKPFINCLCLQCADPIFSDIENQGNHNEITKPFGEPLDVDGRIYDFDELLMPFMMQAILRIEIFSNSENSLLKEYWSLNNPKIVFCFYD